jgi:hypothetical protein
MEEYSMKKILALLLAFSMAISMSACARTISTSDDDEEKSKISADVDENEDENEDDDTISDSKENEDNETEDEEDKDDSEDISIKIPNKPNGTKPDFGPLSDDIYSFQIEIDGDVYQFPMKYTDFISYGWVIEGNDTETIDPNYYMYNTFAKGKLKCFADIINFDINALPINECYVGGITISDSQALNAKNFTMRLPKGIEYGKSTVEDVKAAYGTPSDTYESEYYTSLRYEYASYQEIKIVVSADTGRISEIEVTNLTMPEDFVAGEVDTTVPEIVNKYKSPDKLDDDFDAFTVKYGGDLYQLPAPVSCFTANGWKIIEKESEMVVTGRSFGWVTLIKDNQRLRVIANNYCEKATAIDNCFVTKVQSGDYDNKTEIIIAKNITIGMSVAQLEKTLSGADYKKNDSSSSYDYYEIEAGDSVLDGYEIQTDKKTVTKIVVEYSPKYSDYVR